MAEELHRIAEESEVASDEGGKGGWGTPRSDQSVEFYVIRFHRIKWNGSLLVSSLSLIIL